MDRAELRKKVFQGLAEAHIGNARVEAEDVNDILNDGYQEVARASKCLTRMGYLHSYSGVQEYGLPLGMFAVDSLWYDNQPTKTLRKVTLKTLRSYFPNYYYDTAGTPLWAYMPNSEKKIGLYPKPTADIAGTETMWAISGAVRTVGHTVTCVTAANTLAVGDIITITGSTAGTIDGIFPVLAVPVTHLGFTVDIVGTNFASLVAAGSASDITPIHVLGATLPLSSTVIAANNFQNAHQLLEDETDEPAFADNLHNILADYAVWWLETGLLLESDKEQARGSVARTRYDAKLQELKDLPASGMGIATVSGANTQR